ncbi:MAG: hypothetical protein AABZ12_04455 [Planctomycetota bacterium]
MRGDAALDARMLQPASKMRRFGVARKFYRWSALAAVGGVLAFLPGCVEVYLLNIATPFLLAQ